MKSSIPNITELYIYRENKVAFVAAIIVQDITTLLCNNVDTSLYGNEMKGNKAYSNSIVMCILHTGSYYSNDKGCCDMRRRRYVELIKSSIPDIT